MARVTVEDCVEKVADRFELVALASQRAKDIAAGAELTMERNDEKNTVIALREIAAELIGVEGLRENLIKHHQKERPFTPAVNSEGTEISAEELDREEFELKELEAAEQELDIKEDLSEETVESKAAEEVAEELEQAGDNSFAEDNLDVED